MRTIIKKKFSAILHSMSLRIAWYLIKVLTSTYRFHYEGVQNFNAAKSSGTFIFAVWHEHVVGLLSGHAGTDPYLTLASRSKDGDYAAFISSKMGFTPVRGSSRKGNTDKGGKEALEEYISKLAQGVSGGITIDGPKGPRRVCKIGIVKIAQQSGRPILPIASIASKYWTVNSWDKFKIPKPFATVTIRYAAPISIPKEASPEEMDKICVQVGNSIDGLERL